MADTFIITGAFFRTNEKLDIEERVVATMHEIGLSITLTTVTTMIAFLLSSLSSIRAIRWLGCYAFLTIFIDAIYQVTFYIALLVLDERRIKANRRDVCFCVVVSDEKDNPNEDTDATNKQQQSNRSICSTSSNDEGSESDVVPQPTRIQSVDDGKVANSGSEFKEPIICRDSTTATMDESEVEHLAPACERVQEETRLSSLPENSDEVCNESTYFADKIMTWYARRVVPNRCFQLVVCVAFVGYFILCCYRASLLRQEFKTQDYVVSFQNDAFCPPWLFVR